MDPSPVVIEGKLLKRGEYISTWRTRWFVLRADGTFRGYKQQPASELEPPINLFEVRAHPRPHRSGQGGGRRGENEKKRQGEKMEKKKERCSPAPPSSATPPPAARACLGGRCAACPAGETAALAAGGGRRPRASRACRKAVLVVLLPCMAPPSPGALLLFALPRAHCVCLASRRSYRCKAATSPWRTTRASRASLALSSGTSLFNFLSLFPSRPPPPPLLDR